MQTAQPRMQEIQKKYKDPKRRQEETLKVYRELNINPLGCFIPLAIQMMASLTRSASSSNSILAPLSYPSLRRQRLRVT